MRNKKVIVFDMDGVLFDSIPFAERSFIEGHPGFTQKMYRELHSGNFHEEAKKYSHLKREETEEEKNNRSIAYAQKKSEAPMFEGIKDLLVLLHKSGYILALNTNAYERNCFPLLERSGIKSLFDFIATAEVSKSKIDKFKLIKETYKTHEKNILFITDALGDVKEAAVAQIPTVAVTWGVHDRAYFEGEPRPNLLSIVDTVKELEDLILAI